MLAAGTLRHRITIEHPVEVQDEAGEPTKQWQEIPAQARVWAKREDLAGRELFQAQQVNAQVTTQFTIRWRSDIDARMRVVSDGVTYPIEAPQDPEGRRESLVLLCSRSVN
ncbi:MAG: phage head closure protein [Vicinamibacterales bacterium]